jgi:riboflavin kinase/FMN adenylyltransferase
LRVYRGLDELPARRKASALTIGNFDGVHRGHRSLINRVLSHAKAENAVPTVATFDPHPQAVLRGVSPVALVTPERKLELLEEAGIEQVVIIHFDETLSLVEPEEFVEDVLVRQLRMKAIVVGSVFRFGHRARGDTALLKSLSSRLGYKFEAARLTRLAGRTVSSTEIRYALAGGDLGWANRALGRSHRLSGRVIEGSGRGRQELGFPTANLDVDEGLCLPAVGIYAGWFGTETQSSLRAAISVGTNPTYGQNPISVEAFVLDFDGDVYGQQVDLDFVERLRDEEKFASSKALREAMEADINRTRRALARRRR